MADKPVTIRRTRIGRKIGHFDDSDIARLNVALSLVMARRIRSSRSVGTHQEYDEIDAERV